MLLTGMHHSPVVNIPLLLPQVPPYSPLTSPLSFFPVCARELGEIIIIISSHRIKNQSDMHHSSTVARNEKKKFTVQVEYQLDIFLSPMHYSSTVAKNKNIFYR